MAFLLVAAHPRETNDGGRPGLRSLWRATNQPHLVTIVTIIAWTDEVDTLIFPLNILAPS